MKTKIKLNPWLSFIALIKAVVVERHVWTGVSHLWLSWKSVKRKYSLMTALHLWRMYVQLTCKVCRHCNVPTVVCNICIYINGQEGNLVIYNSAPSLTLSLVTYQHLSVQKRKWLISFLNFLLCIVSNIFQSTIPTD